MREEFITNNINTFKEQFKSMTRIEKEEYFKDMVKGIHSMTGAYLNALANPAFMAITSKNLDLIIDSPITDSMLQLFCDFHNASEVMKSDINDAKLDDYMVHGKVDNIRKAFTEINRNTNRVFLYEVKKEKPGNVIKVNFRTNGK